MICTKRNIRNAILVIFKTARNQGFIIAGHFFHARGSYSICGAKKFFETI
jgi:hypothetical protein